MKIKYRHQRFNSSSAEIISQANSILQLAASEGWGSMTLRQLYYQFVSKAYIPNTVKDYKRLGSIITNGRYAGLIDWTMIEDAGRNAYHFPHRPTAEDVLKGIEEKLCINPWLKQEHYIEVWVEKQALESTIARPSSKWLTPYMACKGYLSASEAWRASLRFEDAIQRGKKPVLLHLGDHDPSGIDMTRDNDDRLSEFLRQGIHVERIALNMDQVEEHKPPPNPAKEDDTRFKTYKDKFGDESWELDALSQNTIGSVIENAITKYIDKYKWDSDLAEQTKRRISLANLSYRWREVEKLLQYYISTGEDLEFDGDTSPMTRLNMYDEAMDMGATLNTGEFMQWIFDRLVNVHKEHKNYDYMLSFKERIDALIAARNFNTI